MQHLLRRLAPALVVGALLLLAAAPIASADLVEVATVNGTIVDSDGTRILYRTPDDTWRVKDTAALGSDTLVPLPAGKSAGAFDWGRLIPGGALVSANTDTLYEWHSGDLASTDLGGVSPGSIDTGGDYAIWYGAGSLWRLNLLTADKVQITNKSSAGDVAASGEVAYSRLDVDYNVWLWHGPGNETLLSPGNHGPSTGVIFDGSTVVYGRGNPSSGFTSTFFVAGSSPEEELQDGNHKIDTVSTFDYRLAGGWIAYRRAENAQVWTRSPGGQYEQVAAPAGDEPVFVREVNSSGQVAYERDNGDQTTGPFTGSETLLLGQAGDNEEAFPVESKPRNSFHYGWNVFFANDHWYLVTASTLTRLDTDTAITAGPPPATNSGVGHFRFASSAAQPEFTCKIDDQDPVPCDTPYATPPLSDGSHTLTVTSKNGANDETDSTPATRTWLVDTTPPPEFAVHSPANGSMVPDSKPTLSWQAAQDAESGIKGYDVYVDFVRVANDLAPDATSFTPSSDLADGQHTWRVVAKNNAGDERVSETPTFTVDTGPPTTPALDGPADGSSSSSARPTFTWSGSTDAGTGVAGYDVEIGGNTTRVGPGTTSFTPDSDIADGQHTWRVVAFDGAGNRAPSATRQITIDTRAPDARIVATPNPALTGDDVELSAASTVTGGSPLTRYEWDLDGDGSYERDTAGESTTTTSYATAGVVSVGVRVTDAAGRTDIATVSLSITPAPLPGTPGISINDGDRFTNNRHVTLTARWPKYATSMLIANDGGFDGAEPRELHAHPKWRLASSGKERLPTNVYVRFSGGLAGNETYQDDIILDLTDPVLVSASAKHAAKRSVKVRLRARDGISGIKSVQFARNKRHPGPNVRFRRTMSLTKAPRFARVSDRAGNRSTWKRIARG